MRFIIAAFAAFLVLMLDFDRSASPITSYTSETEASSASHEFTSDAVSFAARFIESAASSS
jgi:hypothetical protein